MTRQLETAACGLLVLSLSGCPGGAPPPVKAPVRVEAKVGDAAPVELPLPPGALRRLGPSSMTHPNLRGLTFLDDGRLLSWSHRDEDRSHVRLWNDQGRLETIYTTGTIVDARGNHLLIDRQGMELIHATNGRRVRRLGERNAYQLKLLGDGKGHLSWNDSKVTVTRPDRDPLVIDATADITAVAHGEGGSLITAAEDDHVRRWDLATGEQTLDIKGDDDAHHLSLSRDGKRLAMDDPAAVWDLAQNKAIFELPLAPDSLALSADGKHLAAVHEGNLVVYDVDEARMVWMRSDIDTTYLGAPQLAFSPDGKRLVTGTLVDEAQLRVFATNSGNAIGTTSIAPSAVAMVSAANEVWVGTGRGDIVVFDPDDGREQARMGGHDRTVRALARSPSGRLIASTADDGMVILWDRETRSERRRFSRLKPSALAFVDDDTLLVGHDDGPPVLWSLEEPPPDLWRIEHHGGRMLEGRAPLSAAGKTMALTRRSTVALLDADTGRHIGSLPRDYGEVQAISADGTRIATYQNRQLTLWDVTRSVTVHRRKTEGFPQLAWGRGWLAMAHGPRLQVMSEAGKTLRDVVHGQGDITAVAIVDDDRFVTLSSDGAALVWSRKGMPAAESEAEPPDDELPALLAPLSSPRSCGAAKPDGYGGHLPPCAIRRFGRRRFGHDSHLQRLTFSPDGRHLAGEGGSWDRGVTIWDATTGERRRHLPTSAMALSVEFHPNGRDVFVRAGRQLTRWPIFGGAPRTTTVGYSDHDATAISPSGEHVAVGDAYGQVVILQTSTLRKIGALRVGLAPVRRLGFVGEDGLLAQTLGPKTAVWRWRAGEKVDDVFGNFDGFTVLPDGRLLGADAGVLRVGLPPKVYRTKLEVGGHDDLAVAMDGNTVAITATDYDEKTYEDLPERVVIYDLDTETSRRAIPIGDTDAIALSPDGTWLAVAKGTSVQLWDTKTGKPRPLSSSHRQAAIAAAFADGGQTIVTADGQDVRRWNAKTGAAKGSPWQAVTSLQAVFLPGGKQLLAVDGDDAAVWTIGAPTTPLKDFDVYTIDNPGVSSDGKRVAFFGYGGKLRILSAPKLDVVHEIALPEAQFVNAVFLPGKVVVGGSDETSWVFDVQTGQRLQTLPAAGWVATARDGTWTVVGDTVFDRDLKPTGRLEGVLPWAPLAVSPRGWAAVRGTYDRVHIYDLKTRRRLLLLPPEALGPMTVSPDGTQLLTAADDVLLWDIALHLP